jgi:hypothetical protein
MDNVRIIKNISTDSLSSLSEEERLAEPKRSASPPTLVRVIRKTLGEKTGVSSEKYQHNKCGWCADGVGGMSARVNIKKILDNDFNAKK